MNNASQNTVDVEYVGNKPQRADTVAGTGIVWHGKGNVQQVPASAWSVLARHPDIWRKAGEKPAAQPKPAEVAMRPAPLDKLNDVEIHVLAKERGYRLHNKLAGENLRAKFLEAETADERVKRDVIAE